MITAHAPDRDQGVTSGAVGGVEFTEFADVFDAAATSPGEAENLRLRAKLMDAIKTQIAAREMTQRRAAALAGITEQRMSDLVKEKIDKFSLDALVNIGAALDVHTEVCVG